MPIIIFGARGRTTRDPEGTARTGSCPSCGQIVQLAPVRMRRYFTLFFIPIFPIEKGTRAIQCPHCKAKFRAGPKKLP